jgi:hypothetical protein
MVYGTCRVNAVLRIHYILVWIRIRGSMPLINGPDPDPVIFVIDLQDANRNLIFKKVFCLFLFEGTFFKDEKSKRSHKTVGIKDFLTIFA